MTFGYLIDKMRKSNLHFTFLAISNPRTILNFMQFLLDFFGEDKALHAGKSESQLC